MELQKKILIGLLLAFVLAGCTQPTQVQPKTANTIDLSLELQNRTDSSITLSGFVFTTQEYKPGQSTPLELFEETLAAHSTKTIQVYPLATEYWIEKKNSDRMIKLSHFQKGDTVTIVFDNNDFWATNLMDIIEQPGAENLKMPHVPLQAANKFQEIKNSGLPLDAWINECTRGKEYVYAVISTHPGWESDERFFYTADGNFLGETQVPSSPNSQAPAVDLDKYTCTEVSSFQGDQNLPELKGNNPYPNLEITPVKESFALGEEIKVRIKNNGPVPFYAIKSCSRPRMDKENSAEHLVEVKDAQGKELQLERTDVMQTLDCPLPVLSIAPGEEKVLTVWNQKYYVQGLTEQVQQQAGPGEYLIVFNDTIAKDFGSAQGIDLTLQLYDPNISKNLSISIAVKIRQ